MLPRLLLVPLGLLLALPVSAQQKEPRGYLPPQFESYFQKRVAEIAAVDWSAGITPGNWPAKQVEMRRQLRGMLGLEPLPEATPLQPVITGTVQGDGYVVDKLYFQSLPGLYVTANCYHPAGNTKPLPTVLCVCGHARVEENGIALGNKTNYEPHASWYARHGYVCLVIDTIELGEIRGEHHGTYGGTRMWWAARGYTPAGVETWNGMRAIDYLLTRPDVDPRRIGVTGRSGGGAYSWYIAAVDERIAAAAPTAGITTLQNHILDGTIEGHCDCMFMVNSEQWDFDRVAALVAPRPLLIVNTDKDEIFPLDGVMEIYHHTRALYRQLGHEENIGLHIAEGPHADIQPLNTGEAHWMDRFLQGADRSALTDEPMYQRHKPAELRVFTKIPDDERVTSVDQWFGPAFVSPAAAPEVKHWPAQRAAWIDALSRDSFRAAGLSASRPPSPHPQLESVDSRSTDGVLLTLYHLRTAAGFSLPLWVFVPEGSKPADLHGITLRVLDDDGWTRFRAACAVDASDHISGPPTASVACEELKTWVKAEKRMLVYLCPRGVGREGLAGLTPFKQRQIQRRFHLIGESLESGQVADIRDAILALRDLEGPGPDLALEAEGAMAVNSVYAQLFGGKIDHLELRKIPASHWQSPVYLDVLRHLDLPQAVAMAAERGSVSIVSDDPGAWAWATSAARSLGFAERLRILPATAQAARP